MNVYIDILLTGVYALFVLMFMGGILSLPFYAIAVFLEKNKEMKDNGSIIAGTMITGLTWLLMWLYCCYYVIKTLSIALGWMS